ncbi:hypothetical protein CAPTEDRAFT_200790 [Capitella teleta]|uniref:RNA-binding region-containing protein 3 n=1 Tax=Capitella teleta TaxID=283909 RepID=R7TAC6_CAPTE|nr:hypothetical protein CAPTEDRAFT_200790 [Capitella teleta]|eukprot:ELT90688.1 hypothetical protein CAPTEDRAFT_200790 [Capitella teleta]
MNEANTLRVKHLPPELSESDQIDLLKHFGAEHVKVMARKGGMKHTAFVLFSDHCSAKKALQRLHQLKVMGSILVAEFSTQTKHHPKVSDDWKGSRVIAGRKQENSDRLMTKKSVKAKKSESKAEVTRKLDSVSHKWGCVYPINPQLSYLYPPPTESTLQNIASALVSVPKFYVQVLHLMNKMSLPVPFGPVTARPPLVPDVMIPAFPPPPPSLPPHSSSESEIDSEGEAASLEAKPVKRPRSTPAVKPSEVFEEVSAPVVKSFQFKLPDDLAKDGVSEEANQEEVEGGFGKMEPSTKDDDDDSAEEEEWGEAEFISSRSLRKGRLSEKEMREYFVFKKYDSGEPTTRLYIKNLSKAVTEKDLHHIYGRYVNWENEQDRLMFDMRLMKEGRMKGQAFVTLPSVSQAEKAVRETHAFLLIDKPLVVQFARSAKPKETDPKKK